MDTIVPFADAHFRLRNGRKWHAIAGASLGGFSAYQLAFQQPAVFSSAGVFGNGLVVGLESQTEAWLQAIPYRMKPRVFLNSGEQDTYMVRQARALIPLLDKYGIPHQEIFTTGGHSGDYWLSNFPAYLRWLAEDWK